MPEPFGTTCADRCRDRDGYSRSELTVVARGPARRAQTAGAASMGAAYLTVTDHGRPDRLVGATTPAAGSPELHETIQDNGGMKMRPVAVIALDPGKPVTLAPGSDHVMLMGLKAPLKAGDSLPLTLTFEHAKPITVIVSIEAVGASGAMQGQGAVDGMQGHMGHMP